MEVVKKNVLSIVCGVVALVALVFHFVVNSRGYGKLQADVAEAAKPIKAAASVANEPRKLPQTTDAPPATLAAFPTEWVIEQNRQRVGLLQKNAAELVNQLLRLNDRSGQVLVRGVLPGPESTAPAAERAAYPAKQEEFRRAYWARTHYLDNPAERPRKVPNRPIQDQHLIHELLEATVPATQAEIDAARDKLWQDEYVQKLRRRVGTNEAENLEEVDRLFLAKNAGFAQQFLANRARSYKMYLGLPPAPEAPGGAVTAATLTPAAKVAVAALSINEGVTPFTPQPPTARQIWYAQAALWVQQDVCRTIAEMNADSADVTTSPVKHLFRLNVPPDVRMYKVPAPSATGAPAPASGEVKDYSVSFTGRVANPMYDVVHFDVEAVVDAAFVDTFIRKLQQSRLCVVLQTEVQSVDLSEALDLGCFYGSRPVSYVKIHAEALFLRAWTVGKTETTTKPNPDGGDPIVTTKTVGGLMPKDVQTDLGIGVVAPAGAAPADPGAAPA
ncbi:MAG TPA: hypothetical protein VF796_02450, partial [Humisphaera sp.]